MTQVDLGPFVLEERIGKGGMGDVWRGRHRVQGSSVAIKVITPRWAREPRYAEALSREVEACARLTHRGIVSVLDFGSIPYATASATFGAFHAESPFFVMEYIEGGPLTYAARPWREIHDILRRLLDALAHAHARGVIHRDIKPSNVLLDSSGRTHLTDFGLAHVVDGRTPGADEMSGASGTPRYMAPEQILGDWREQGPWTDLYALGCLAHGLLMGRPPYEGRVEDVLQAHLNAPPPTVGNAAPDGFDSWLQLIMAKDPRRRFRRPADALWALLKLGDTHDGPTRVGGWDDGLETLSALTIPFRKPADPDLAREDLRTTNEIELPRAVAPPMPEQFEPDEAPLTPEILGAGVGIFGMRTVPLVGRRAEREVIWEELLAVNRDRRCRAVLLRGEAGTGKSRLAEWVGERAHELGAATLLRVVHSPLRGAVDGVAPMLSRALRLQGLTPAETQQRISDFWFDRGADTTDQIWCEALTCIVMGDKVHDGTARTKFISVMQRWAAVSELLTRLAEQRPVYLWIDDVQWGADALGLCRYLLDHPTPHPVLLVLTVRDEALHDRPAERSRLKAIADHDSTTTVRIGALPESQRMRLVRSLLGLDSDAARHVAERAGGNPLFAVQLVGDWIEQNALVLGPTGFGLRDDVALDVPDDIHSLWQRRLEHALSGLTPDEQVAARDALEVAAALGQDVDETELRHVMAYAGIPLVARFASVLVLNGLAVRTPRGASFTHGMFRESLERAARAAGRWRRWNLACAEVLAAQLQPPESWRRVSQHFVAAEDWERALEPLHRTALIGFDLGDYEEANAALDRLRHAVDFAGLSDRHTWHARAWTLTARVLRERGDILGANAALARAEPIAREQGSGAVLAEVLGTRASLATQSGDLEGARPLIDESIEIWKEIGDSAGLGHAYRARNWLLFWSGDYDGARAALEAAKEAYEAGNDDDGLGWVHYEKAAIALHTEDNDEALRLTETAMECFERVGNIVALADCLNMLGELARIGGDLELAGSMYREALAIYEPIGHANVLIARENLGLTLLAGGEPDAAAPMLIGVLEANERLGRAPFIMRITAELLECFSELGQLDAWERHFARFDEVAGSTPFADRDTAGALERAGDRRQADRDVERAIRAWESAQRLWEQLGRDDHAGELGERIGALRESRP